MGGGGGGFVKHADRATILAWLRGCLINPWRYMDQQDTQPPVNVNVNRRERFNLSPRNISSRTNPVQKERISKNAQTVKIWLAGRMQLLRKSMREKRQEGTEKKQATSHFDYGTSPLQYRLGAVGVILPRHKRHVLGGIITFVIGGQLNFPGPTKHISTYSTYMHTCIHIMLGTHHLNLSGYIQATTFGEPQQREKDPRSPLQLTASSQQ